MSNVKAECRAAVESALALLEGADWDNPIVPTWGRKDHRDPDWLKVDETKASEVKDALWKHHRAVRGQRYDQVIPYVHATIGFDGYCHVGRSRSSVRQLKLMLEEFDSLEFRQ